MHHNQIKDKKTGEDRYVTSIIADDMIFLTKINLVIVFLCYCLDKKNEIRPVIFFLL